MNYFCAKEIFTYLRDTFYVEFPCSNNLVVTVTLISRLQYGGNNVVIMIIILAHDAARKGDPFLIIVNNSIRIISSAVL